MRGHERKVWVAVIVTLVVMSLILWNAYKKAEEREALIKKQKQEAAESQYWKEWFEKEKELEAKTKLMLKEDMIENYVGDTVDIYGVKIKVANPYETKDKGPKKIVTFKVDIENNSKEEIKLSHANLDLERDSYFHTEGALADTTHAFVSSKDMEHYYSLDTDLNSDQGVIPSGGKITGTVSYYIGNYDALLAYAPDNLETNFTLKIDVSDLPFLNSFERHRIEFNVRIGWDTYYDKLILEQK